MVRTAGQSLQAEVPGSVRHRADGPGDLPAVGDWVILRVQAEGDLALIDRVLSRRSVFSRKVAGDRTDEQVIAANVDVLFIVMALNEDLNERRAERYLTMAWESGALPVLVLTKPDLSADPAGQMARVAEVAPGVDVLTVCPPTGEGLDHLKALLLPNRTGAVVGSSGVGKSTLLNALAGRELLRTQDIRGDGKGRHTTTHRELVTLPGGGVLIDTPGMRELQLWSNEEGLDAAFQDISELAAGCRFSDCAHEREPGCAVKDAVARGALEESRLASFRKLQAELAWLERKQDKRLQNLEAKRVKKLNEDARRRSRAKSFRS